METLSRYTDSGNSWRHVEPPPPPLPNLLPGIPCKFFWQDWFQVKVKDPFSTHRITFSWLTWLCEGKNPRIKMWKLSRYMDSGNSWRQNPPPPLPNLSKEFLVSFFWQEDWFQVKLKTFVSTYRITFSGLCEEKNPGLKCENYQDIWILAIHGGKTPHPRSQTYPRNSL